jgi:ribosome-associated protein
MEATELKDFIVNALDEKSGGDIQELELTGKTIVADYFVIATGKSNIHVKTLAEYVETKLEERGIPAARSEGVKDGRWAVLDYNSVIVHIFNADTRDFYCLEKLWKA